MVLIDTDVLVIHFRYPRDRRFQANSDFMLRVQENTPCITIYNVMEFLGQMSFNLPPAKLSIWDGWLRAEYGLTVIRPEGASKDADSFFWEEVYERPLSKMLGVRNGMAFQDALIIGLGERVPGIEAFVTWNARHFRTKTTLDVLTPEEYVQSL